MSRGSIVPGRAWSRLLVIAQTAALIAVIAVALHYRAEAGPAGHGRQPATGPRAPVLPQMSSIMLRLPAGPPVVGTVLITAAAQPGGNRAQFMVSAFITGGQPDTVYDRVGNDSRPGRRCPTTCGRPV
jgi:hypothetical protein